MPHFLIETWKIPLCVLLFTLAFPPWDLSFLVWIALVPGISVGMQSRSLRHALLLAAWACFWVNLLLFPWIYPALRDYVELPPFIAAVVWQAFGLICQPQLYALAVGLYLLRNVTSAVGVAFSIAFLYTGVDWVAPKIFMDTMGHATHNMPYLRQSADLGGAYGITFLIVFHNVALYCLLKSYLNTRKLERAPVGAYGLAVLMVLSTLTYGIVRHDQVTQTMANADRRVSIAGIQANTMGFDKNDAYETMLQQDLGAKSNGETEQSIPVESQTGNPGAEKSELDLFYDETFRSLISIHMEMSALGLESPVRPDVVIWPETTYPALFGYPISEVHLESERKMLEFVEKEQVSLIFGSYWRDEEDREHNSAFHLAPISMPSTQDNTSNPTLTPEVALDRYDKTNLLLLGEYFPFEESEIFRRIFPATPNFGRGDGTKVFDLPLANGDSTTLTPVLCYEILFPDYLRNAMADNPDFILNLTNDSWFGEYGEPHMHMAFASFRALELRIPLVRITNTGVTATVLQDGSQVDRIETSIKRVHRATLPLAEFEATPYRKGGHYFPVIALCIGVLLTAWYARRYRNV